MILLFLVSAISSFLAITPAEYKELASKAKGDLRVHINSPSMPKTGFYDLHGLSFNLQATLLNNESLELFGSALGNNVLALVPNRELFNSTNLQRNEDIVFVDVESQDLFKIKELISDDGVVMILKVVKVDPFTVFSEINMKTSAENDDNAYVCEPTGKLGATCKAEFGYNWQTPSDLQDGFDLRALELPTDIPGLSAYHGAYARGYSSVDINIHSLKNIEINADMNVGVAAGLGFRFADHIGPFSILDEGLQYPLYGYSKSFFGYKFGFEIDIFTTVSLKDLNLYFPQEIYYYRQAQASLNVAGHYKIKDGVSFDTPNFTFTSYADTNLNNFSIKDYVKNIGIDVNPEFNIGLEIQLSTGSSTLSVQGGGRFGMHWNFTGNHDQCSIPWLYGNYDAYLQAVYRNTQFKVLGWEVIPAYEKDWTLWQSDRTDDHCLFGSTKDEIQVRKGDNTFEEITRTFSSNASNTKRIQISFTTSTIVAAVLGIVALCLLIALIVVSVQKRKLQKENNFNTLLADSDNKYVSN